MNFSRIPVTTGSTLSRSDTNNLVETTANPFSFIADDTGEKTASVRMIRNFTYNCDEKTNAAVKGQLAFGDIIQTNPLIKYAEQQWGQEIEVEKTSKEILNEIYKKLKTI